MMRRISRKLALTWTPAVLLLGLSLQSNAQSTPLGQFDVGVSPNPVGYANANEEVSAFVLGSTDGPTLDGTIDLYISTSTTACIYGGGDLGYQSISGDSSYTYFYFYEYFTPDQTGLVPICGSYTGDSNYASQTTGPILLTVYGPATLTTYAAPQPVWGNSYNLYFVLSYNSGQLAPTGTITLYDDNGNQVGSPVTVGSITLPSGQSAVGAIIPNPSFTDLTSPETYNYSATFTSGDNNYVSQSANGSLYFVNPLTSVTPASVMAGPILTSSDTACSLDSGAPGLQVTLNGYDFNGDTVAEINGTPLNIISSSSTQLTVCVPNTYLTSVGSVPINVTVSGSNPVTLQVSPPYAVTTADSASPLTFAYGQSLASTQLTGTATRTSSNDAAVPIGSVSFTLNSPIDGGISYSLGSASLSTVSTQGTYLNPNTTNPPYAGPIDFNQTQKMIAADLNGDGYVDVVGLPGNSPGTTAAGPYLQIFLSTGSDAFQAEQQVYAGCAPQDFAVGDINNDGVPDLVVICPQTTSGTLQGYYMLGIPNGNGTFQSPVSFTSNIPYWDPSFVVLGQFNGDGLNEIAVIDSNDTQMQVISPFGTPTYGPIVYFSGADGPVVSAGVADFNQDNLSDIALEEYYSPNAGSDSDGSGAILIYTSLGVNSQTMVGQGFSFDNSVRFLAGTYNTMQSMAVTSLEGDNWPDVAIADPGGGNDANGNYDNGSIQVFVNARDYSGDLSTPVIFQPGGNVANELAVAGPPFPVAANLPLSNAVAPGWNLVFSYPVPTGDVNEIYVGELQFSASQNTLSQVNSINTGTQAYETDGGFQPEFIVAADMNGDGFLDYAATGYIPNDSAPIGIQEELIPYYYGDDAQTSTTATSAQPLNGAPQSPPPGTYTVNLTYPGNQLFQANNTAATQAQITISQATPIVTSWPTASGITYGQTLASSTLSGGVSTPPGTFAWTTPTIAPGAGAQSESVTFTPADTTDYAAVTGSVTVNVSEATPTVTSWPTASGITYGQTLASSTLSGGVSTPSGTFAWTAPNTAPGAGPQPESVTFTPTDTADYTTLTGTVIVAVSKAAPTITWPAPSAITYGTALSSAQLDATSPTAGTFAYDPALGTVLTAGAHTLGVTFTPTDTTDYATASGSVTIQVNQATPTITWPAPAAITYGTALSSTQLDATTPTAGTFTYTPPAGTKLGAGSHTLSVTFTPTDATDYTTATTSVSIQVSQATPTVTWAAPAAISYGTALSSTQLDAASPVPGTFAYTPAAGTTLAAGSHTLSVTFTPTDTTDYTTATTSVSIQVSQATPTVTWAAPAAINYGTALSSTQLDAASPVPGTFAYTPAAGTTLAAGSHTLSVTFTPTDATDYTTATTSVSIQVNQATPTVTWGTPAAINYGTALSSTQLDAASPVPGTFTYTPAAGTVLTAGAKQLSVTFVPTDNADYQAVTKSVTIQVNQASSTITWAAPSAIAYGTALSATQLDATAFVPGTFAYNPALGTVLTAGTHTLGVTFTPTDSTDYQGATASVSIQVSQATPTITWTNPTAIGYGTALGATQLDATASTAGTFTYTPAAGTTLTAGSHTLNVSFAPTDTTDYTTASGSVTIQVNQATPVITWTSPGNISYGTALSSAQLDATATPSGGTFTYNPAAGTILPVGTQTLSVTYVPTDTTDYATATATTTVNVITSFTLTAIAPTSAPYGSGITTVTLTGTGFTQNSVVQLNGTAISTTFVSPTQLTAQIPASFFQQLSPGTITVFDTVKNVTTSSIAFSVTLPNLEITFSGPSTAAPGEQPTLNLVMSQPYPIDIQGTMTLTVDPLAPGGPTDPSVQFSTGGTTYNFTIPAGSTTTPSVQIQSGTLSATITVTLTLEANGQDIEPPSIVPVVVSVPNAAPVITSATLTRSGNTLTVTIQGYSSTRDMSLATFDFTAASGSSISNPDIDVDVASEFTTWYASDTSVQYGSSFSYSQVFNLNNDSSTIGSVSVVLTNSVGQSNQVTAQ